MSGSRGYRVGTYERGAVMGQPDRLAEAQRIIAELAPDHAEEFLTSSHDERTFLLGVASTWALVDIAQSLRTIARHTPTPTR
jgi:hypothetical protein